MAHLRIPVSQNDHIQGAFESPIKFVEYGDYQCPYCRMAYPVVKKLQKKMGNELCFIFRNFPLKQAHPFALMAAQAAEAAALQNKFWEMHDLLYENQPLLGPELISELAIRLGLNKSKFVNDMESAAVLNKIEEDFKNGVRSGVNGTPCFFINENRYDGAPTYEELVGILSQAASEF